MPHTRALLAVVLCVCGLGLIPPAAGVRAQAVPGATAFGDSFESDMGWKVFEELVGGSPCYAAGVGSVGRTTALAFTGQQSLSVWANALGGDKSNHLIAYTSFAAADARGLWRYRVRVLIPPDSGGQGQTGPEISIQNTRAGAGGAWATATAGLQYIANPHPPEAGGWHLWAETTAGRADWSDVGRAAITAGQWYTVTLDVDYGANSYIGFGLDGAGTSRRVSLSGYRIAEEAKGFSEPSFVLTLESENLWNNCAPGVVFRYQVLYDDVEAYKLYLSALPMVSRGP